MADTATTNLLSSASDGGVVVKRFTPVPDYTTFYAQYMVENEHIVVQFFRTKEHSSNAFWKQRFPEVLSEFAQSYFKATYPQLVAMYVEEVDSWWMRAGGFAHLDIPALMSSFFEGLDAQLEAAK